MSGVTPGIRQDWPPEAWRQHRFGLPPERWAALAGQVFWITGAGTGYGRALAMCLAAAGGRVALTGRRTDKLEETLTLLHDFAPGATTLPVPGDVASPAAMKAAAETIEERLGGLHGLVCAAALPQAGRGGLAAIDPDDLRAMLDVNVLGQLFPLRAALPAMSRAGRYRAVFLTSRAGWAFTPGFGPYNVTKAALNSLGACLAAEVQAGSPEADVQINVLSPGEARTEMNSASDDSPFAVAQMALALLSHPPEGPNGRFFHRDGQHWSFADRPAWPASLLEPPPSSGSRRPPSGEGDTMPVSLLRRLRQRVMGG